MTFKHPSSDISYAILRAPQMRNIEEKTSSERLPVILGLHGAGLEAESPQMRHALDSVPDLSAWILFPTGMSTWSGDDWHTWGFADVVAAIETIPQWITRMSWSGPGVDTDRWFVCGHSNGGQGTWHALTHVPGKIIGAAPISGYSSIQSYVPYSLWTEAEPQAIAVVQNALADQRHELLCSNFAGIPVLQQHGSADDNVPAFHSRRMRQLIGQSPSSSTYSELVGRGHWFQGVMATPGLLRFYKTILEKEQPPKLPTEFKMVITSPTEMIPSGGLLVDQLVSPERYGRLDVRRILNDEEWHIQTQNILRLHFSSKIGMSQKLIIIDGCEFQSENLVKPDISLVKIAFGQWKVSEEKCRSTLGS